MSTTSADAMSTDEAMEISKKIDEEVEKEKQEGRIQIEQAPMLGGDCTVPFTVQPFAYTSCTSRLRAPQGSHWMGDQWHQL